MLQELAEELSKSDAEFFTVIKVKGGKLTLEKIYNLNTEIIERDGDLVARFLPISAGNEMLRLNQKEAYDLMGGK